jgi:hypothetical protein
MIWFLLFIALVWGVPIALAMVAALVCGAVPAARKWARHHLVGTNPAEASAALPWAGG